MITQKDIEGLFQAVNDMAELRSENKVIKKENEFYKELLAKQLNLPVVVQQRELLIDFCEVYAQGQFEDPDDTEGIVDWYMKVKDN